jgi:DNA-binding transcriptional ArsR family regulator
MEKQDALGALNALAQETRLDVFRLLVRRGGEGLTPGAISTELGLPSATLSFHLKELKSAGIVRCERRGRSLRYRPDFTSMKALLTFLTEQCCEDVGACGPPASSEDSPQPR